MNEMNELELLLQDVERLRNKLNDIISCKNSFNLQDPEIISASQVLNAAITKYNDIIEKKRTKNPSL